MPLYEYECRACGARIEELQRRGEEPPRFCSRCGGELQRIVASRFGIAGGAQARDEASACSFETRGVTCCGSTQRCGSPRCGK
ncbi:MAG: FmdB family zinc ribbon protein [Myxococcales bacterium]|jgi:putative FmdB family regulatory protein